MTDSHCRNNGLRAGGFAMVLVLLAVAMAAALSYAYLMGQRTSSRIAANAAAQCQARAIAESALGLAVAYVQSHDDWRTVKSPGTWVSDEPLAGGTCTVTGEDGEDDNGDGAVEGDGSFTDDEMDVLTLTARGTYRGASHTVRAVVPAFKKALMIVPDPAAMTAEDTDRYTLLRNWGWKVYLLRAQATGAEFDSAAAGMHVIYFPAHTERESDVKDRLKAVSLPIVMEDEDLVHDLDVTSEDGRTWSGASIEVLSLTRTLTDDAGNETTETYKHYITSTLPPGPLAVCSRADTLLYNTGSRIGAQSLAGKGGSPDTPALLALDAGAPRADRQPAKARRVVLPWGGKDFTFSIGSLNSSGQTVLRRSMEWAGSSWRGLLPGIAVWETIEVKDLGTVDGFDASAGDYGGSNVNAVSTLSTNAVSDDCLKISGGLVKGYPFVSPDADAARVLDVSDSASVTGTAGRLKLNVPILAPQAPTDMGGSAGDRSYFFGVYYLAGDAHLGKLTLKGTARLDIYGNSRLYCEKGITMDDSAAIVVTSGSSLTLYTAGGCTIMGSARLNTALAYPSAALWQVLEGNVDINEDARVYARIRTYGGALGVKDSAQLYGTYVGRKLIVSGSGAFHVDTSCSGTITTLGGGFDLSRIATTGVRWVEPR